MDDSDNKKKIDSLIADAYARLIKLFNINEESPDSSVYRTMVATKGDSISYLNAYINYYMGVFEGIFINLFLEEFNAYPTTSQKAFIQDSFEKRFHSFVDIATKYAKKHYKNDLD